MKFRTILLFFVLTAEVAALLFFGIKIARFDILEFRDVGISGNNTSTDAAVDIMEESVFVPEALTWQAATIQASWPERDAHTALTFNDKMWVLGGLGQGSPEYGLKFHKADVWSSENGKDWGLVLDEAPWGKRRAHASAVFQDKMWILGGMPTSRQRTSDAWYSSEEIME